MALLFSSLPPLIVLAALPFVWHAAGRLTRAIKLPMITGYMLAGVASGPYATELITAEGLASLAFVDNLCLSLIALAAGAELQLVELRKIKRQVTWITLGISGCTWVMVFVCTLVLAPYIPFMASAPSHIVSAMASLVATLAMARSPASAIAVLKETEGKGPYCSLVMAVVVLKDVLVFMCFALNIEIAKKVSTSDEAFTLKLLLDPLVSIVVSVVLGLTGGAVMVAMRLPQFSASKYNPVHRLLSSGVRARLRPAAPLAVSGCIFFLAATIHAEPLLSCVTAGLVVANAKFESGAGDTMELLAADMGRLMPVVNVAFFGLVGASLKLGAVRDALWAAWLLYLVRLGGIWLGCHWGSILGGAPEGIGEKVWMGMVTQAGVALGLARIVSGTFPDWGPDFSALAAGVVLMNILSGPPLFKTAVVALGESRAIGLPTMATEFDNTGMKRDGSKQQLRELPQIPIISVLQPGADALAAAGHSLKHFMSASSRELPRDLE